jgi:hypothetical protein
MSGDPSFPFHPFPYEDDESNFGQTILLAHDDHNNERYSQYQPSVYDFRIHTDNIPMGHSIENFLHERTKNVNSRPESNNSPSKKMKVDTDSETTIPGTELGASVWTIKKDLTISVQGKYDRVYLCVSHSKDNITASYKTGDVYNISHVTTHTPSLAVINREIEQALIEFKNMEHTSNGVTMLTFKMLFALGNRSRRTPFKQPFSSYFLLFENQCGIFKTINFTVSASNGKKPKMNQKVELTQNVQDIVIPDLVPNRGAELSTPLHIPRTLHSIAALSDPNTTRPSFMHFRTFHFDQQQGDVIPDQKLKFQKKDSIGFEAVVEIPPEGVLIVKEVPSNILPSATPVILTLSGFSRTLQLLIKPDGEGCKAELLCEHKTGDIRIPVQLNNVEMHPKDPKQILESSKIVLTRRGRSDMMIRFFKNNPLSIQKS